MPESTVFDFNPDEIGHVIADRRLAVPIYQRSYSWGEEEIADFWTDLSGAMADGNAQYFLGNIVLSEEGTEGGYTIIDGQQRLATTLILLAAIQNEFRRRGDEKRARIVHDGYIAVADLDSAEDLPRLQMNSDDDPFFRSLIVDSRSPETLQVLHSSHSLIQQALAYFEERVHNVAEAANSAWADRLLAWVRYLRTDVRIIVVDVPTEADAFLIFETLNDRGADLTIADLLKNYLFGRAGDRLDTVRDGWIASLSALETSAENSLFTTFLRLYGALSTGRLVKESFTKVSRNASLPRYMPSTSVKSLGCPPDTTPRSLTATTNFGPRWGQEQGLTWRR